MLDPPDRVQHRWHALVDAEKHRTTHASDSFASGKDPINYRVDRAASFDETFDSIEKPYEPRSG
jgi:hypothetical protein